MNSFPWVSKASGLSPFLSFSLSLFLAKERILAAYHNYMYLLVLRLVCYLVSLVSIGSQPFLISIAPCFSVLSCCLASAQLSHTARYNIPDIHIQNHSTLPLPSPSSSVLFHLSKMDSSSRNRMPAPSNQQSSRQQAPEQASASITHQ